MKKLLLILAIIATVGAFAHPYKTYEWCKNCKIYYNKFVEHTCTIQH